MERKGNMKNKKLRNTKNKKGRNEEIGRTERRKKGMKQK